MRLFHPPNRVPEEHSFVYVVEGHLCPDVADCLMRKTPPSVYVASLIKPPPQFPGLELEVIKAWQDHHRAAARTRGITLFWAGPPGAALTEVWKQELGNALAEFSNPNRHIRMLVGSEDLGIRTSLGLKLFPSNLVFSSLFQLCATAEEMINHHYHVPTLA
ncbi:MAG: hypothetical protein M1275_00085 [Patescibacteria group bacterium]|nr:hypothetical protein [Patescibacteria group bacterium]